MARVYSIFAALLICSLFPIPSYAQGVAAPDPVGVRLDKDGVLHSQRLENGGRLSELRKAAKGKDEADQMVYLSLPKLFAEAQAHIAAGEPIPNEIRYLGGMVKLQYVFIYPVTNDLVIAGPAEPIDASNPFRPLGTVSGHPVMQLEDFVIALRSMNTLPHDGTLGCDIEVTQDIADRVSAKIKEVQMKVVKKELEAEVAADMVGEAGGKQPIVYYNLDPNSRFAFVCAEADYLLKHLALGLIETPVRKMKSYNEFTKKPGKGHRFSLETDYEAINISADGNAFELVGQSIKINTGLLQRLGAQAGEVEEPARRFVSRCNKYFDELSLHIPSWGDLANISDLTALSALILTHRLHDRVEWDISALLQKGGFPTTSWESPKFADRLCNYRWSDSFLIFTSGGARVDPRKWTTSPTKVEEGAIPAPPKIEGAISLEPLNKE